MQIVEDLNNQSELDSISTESCSNSFSGQALWSDVAGGSEENTLEGEKTFKIFAKIRKALWYCVSFYVF
jgi:hypothetical protein